MESNVLVSGLSDTQYNGNYVYDGEVNGKPSFVKDGISIYYDESDSKWFFYNIDTDQFVLYSTSSDTYPWSISSGSWVDQGIDPTGLVITESPAQQTFGLPADVVALITSRFGSVANFLRLRNQGQV